MSLVKTYDPNFLKQIDTFAFMRSVVLVCVLLSTVFLRREVLGTSVILQIYSALSITFLIALINTSYWQDTLKVRYFIQSQLLYDLLLVSFFVYLTGIDESIYLFLYLLNIVFTALIYRLNGALVVAFLSGTIYAMIFYVNTDTTNQANLHTLAYNELLFLLTALLSGQFMDELNKQRILLSDQRANIARLETINDKLLNNIPVGLLLVDENETLRNINMSAIQLLMLSKVPANSAKVYDLIPTLKGVQQIWGDLGEKRRLRYNFHHRLPGHSKKKFSLQIVALPEEADIGADTPSLKTFIYVFQDISKISELEEKLEMESKLAAVGQLAAGIAHEIRNPLASISGSIETLNSHLKIENLEDQKLIAISLRETKRLNKLITEFLEFAKPKEQDRKTFSLKKLVTEVAEAIQTRIEGAPPKLTMDIDESLMIEADPERIKQVFFNIFINSAEASKQNSANIHVNAYRNIDELKITVKDDGPGIPTEIAKRIFDPFFTTKSSGTGLGLSTVAQILKSNKGSIRALPYDNGACFELIMPLAAPHLKSERAGEPA